MIVEVRGRSVILDEGIASLYGVETKRLNEQIARNRDRFPEDFAFRLNYNEKKLLVANCDQYRNILKKPVVPMAFTEHGALMAAMVLRSKRANEASVWLIRAFVRMRSTLVSHQKLIGKVNELDSLVKGHDKVLRAVVNTIQKMLASGVSAD